LPKIKKENEIMSEFPIGVGPQHEGETVRKGDIQVELGGMSVKRFELVTLKGMDEIEHEEIEIIGPDIPDMEVGSTHPIAIMIDVAGEQLEKDMEPVIERRDHLYINYMEGVWHMGSRDDIWIRISKESYEKGLRSFRQFGEILMLLFTSEMEMIEKIAITFVTDPKTVEELLPQAQAVFQARDDRLRGMRDEDVEEFYGCIMCQSFAPQHVCVISPERTSICGCITWLDGKAAFKMDPEGSCFRIEKGECLDPVLGSYSGVNEAVAEKSMGASSEFYLYSAFDKPHTGCGCFQTVVFYIPEVDGFGVVQREYSGDTVIGQSFSTLAGEVSGGRQIEGMIGVGIDYLRSPKFLLADGGHKRIVWMPKELKERVQDRLPEGLADKIATEDDVSSVDELQEFLERVGHPLLTAA
jgi:acetyl-CoA decarbonylase/synthase complex subunit beta